MGQNLKGSLRKTRSPQLSDSGLNRRPVAREGADSCATLRAGWRNSGRDGTIFIAIDGKTARRTHDHAKICLRRACASLATNEGSAYGLPQRGKSQAMTLCCGSPLQRNSCFSIALAAKSMACCSVWRLSCGSDIHSRMIVRRTTCSGFMSQSLLKLLWRGAAVLGPGAKDHRIAVALQRPPA